MRSVISTIKRLMMYCTRPTAVDNALICFLWNFVPFQKGTKFRTKISLLLHSVELSTAVVTVDMKLISAS